MSFPIPFPPDPAIVAAAAELRGALDDALSLAAAASPATKKVTTPSSVAMTDTAVRESQSSVSSSQSWDAYGQRNRPQPSAQSHSESTVRSSQDAIVASMSSSSSSFSSSKSKTNKRRSYASVGKRKRGVGGVGVGGGDAVSGYERRRSARRVLRSLEGIEEVLSVSASSSSSSFWINRGEGRSENGGDIVRGGARDDATTTPPPAPPLTGDDVTAVRTAEGMTDDLIRVLSELSDCLIGSGAAEGTVSLKGADVGRGGIEELVERSIRTASGLLLRLHRCLRLNDNHIEILLDRTAVIAMPYLVNVEYGRMKFPHVLGPTIAALNGGLRGRDDDDATTVDDLVFPHLEARETVHLLDALLRRALGDLSEPWIWYLDQDRFLGAEGEWPCGREHDEEEREQRECSVQIRELIGYLLRHLAAILKAKRAEREDMEWASRYSGGSKTRLDVDMAPLNILLSDNFSRDDGDDDKDAMNENAGVGSLTKEMLEDTSDLLHEFLAESVEYALDVVDGVAVLLRRKSTENISNGRGSWNGTFRNASLEGKLLVREALRHVSLAVACSEALQSDVVVVYDDAGRLAERSVVARPPPRSVRALSAAFASFVASECHFALGALTSAAGQRRPFATTVGVGDDEQAVHGYVQEEEEEEEEEEYDPENDDNEEATEAVRAAADDLLMRAIALAGAGNVRRRIDGSGDPPSEKKSRISENGGRELRWDDRDVRSVALLRSLDSRVLSAEEAAMLTVGGGDDAGLGATTAAFQASILASLTLPTSYGIGPRTLPIVDGEDRGEISAAQAGAERLEALVGGLLVREGGSSDGSGKIGVRQPSSPWHSAVARRVCEFIGSIDQDGSVSSGILAQYIGQVAQRVDTISPLT